MLFLYVNKTVYMESRNLLFKEPFFVFFFLLNNITVLICMQIYEMWPGVLAIKIMWVEFKFSASWKRNNNDKRRVE